MTLQRFRQIEFWVITALTAFFLLVTLWFAYADYAYVFREIDSLEETRISLRYNWWVNGFLPNISLILTIYGCWFALNRIIFPRYWPHNQTFLLIGWAVIGFILLTGVWSYLYHWEVLDLRHDLHGNVIGAKVISLFRLRNLALYSLGWIFLLTIYTILSQAYQWAIQQHESEINAKVIKDGSRLALIGFVIITVFQILNRDTLLIPSMIWVQGAFVHAGLYHYSILRLKIFSLKPNNVEYELRHKLLIIVLLSFGTSILIDCTYSIFRLKNPYYINLFKLEGIFATWLLSWLGAIAVTLIRQFMVKPLETSLNRNQAELSALRAQINPHFLFNAMNTLYATAIEEKAEKTSQGIQQLSDMMRFMMHENNQDQIDIRQEVQYLHNYIDLQRLRISESDNFELKIDLDDALCLRSVAPMMLIPFVENAFKHGVSLRNQSWIFIKLYCDSDALHFKIHNSLHPRNEDDPEKHSSGIGLANVQKRLELLYPQKHQLLIHQTEKEFSVHLEIFFSGKRKR